MKCRLVKDSDSEGRAFESRRAHHTANPCFSRDCGFLFVGNEAFVKGCFDENGRFVNSYVNSGTENSATKPYVIRVFCDSEVSTTCQLAEYIPSRVEAAWRTRSSCL